MTPEELKKFYKTTYRFNKETGMAGNSLTNWLKKGYVPEFAQFRLERITNGLFKAEYKDDK